MADQRLKLQAGKMSNISQTNQTELQQIVKEIAFFKVAISPSKLE
jgi:hypothetical protein